jgi:hypothetical protein
MSLQITDTIIFFQTLHFQSHHQNRKPEIACGVSFDGIGLSLECFNRSVLQITISFSDSSYSHALENKFVKILHLWDMDLCVFKVHAFCCVFKVYTWWYMV